MSKTSTKLNSSNIIIIRKNLCDKITKYWRTIRNENVMSTKAIKAGLGSGYDLKALYNEITQMAEKRILIKGMLMCLNMGLEFNLDEFKKSNNYSIFAACEAKEAIAQLKMIPTINPTEKSQKGLKGTGKKESFSSAKIAQLIKDMQLKANKYDAAMEEFNTKTTIDLSGDLLSKFKDDIAAQHQVCLYRAALNSDRFDAEHTTISPNKHV